MKHLTIITFVVALLYLPARHIEFSWYDDGYAYYSAATILADLKSANLAHLWEFLREYNVRFRPVYWFWQTSNYVLSGYNPPLHYFWHFVLILTVGFLLYQASRSVFAVILLLLSPVNTANWYRLGPQEPLIAVLILTSFLVWQKYKNNSCRTISLSKT